jgi:hypothetical protein
MTTLKTETIKIQPNPSYLTDWIGKPVAVCLNSTMSIGCILLGVDQGMILIKNPYGRGRAWFATNAIISITSIENEDEQQPVKS